MESFVKRKLLSGLLWQGSASAILLLRGFISLPILAKTLGAEAYGLFTQLLVTLTLVAPIVTLHLDAALVRRLSSETDRRQINSHFFSACACVFATAVAVAFAGAVLFPAPLSGLVFGSTDHAGLARLMSVMIVPQALNLIAISYFQLRKRFRFISSLQIVGVAVQLGAMALIVLNGGGVYGAVLALLSVDLLQLLVVAGLVMRELGLPTVRLSLLRPMLRFSLPLLPSHVSLWVITMSSRFILLKVSGMRDVGIYAASFAFGGLAGFFINPMTYVLLPLLSAGQARSVEATEHHGSVLYAMRLFMMLSLPAAAGVAVLAPDVLRSLATPEFAQGAAAAAVVAAGALAMGIYRIINMVPLMLNRTGAVFVMLCAGMALNLLVGLWAIPRFGMIGAALAYLSSYAAITLWNALLHLKGLEVASVRRTLSGALRIALATGGMCALLLSGRQLAISFWSLLLPAALLYALLLWIFGAIDDSERNSLRSLLRRPRPAVAVS